MIGKLMGHSILRRRLVMPILQMTHFAVWPTA